VFLFFYILSVTTTLLDKMNKKIYSTDLTDKQWQVIEKLVNGKVRKRKHSLRSILDAMLRDFTCLKAGRSLSPSLGLIDSRSVKTSRNGGMERGMEEKRKSKAVNSIS
jgi:hypothetical protein